MKNKFPAALAALLILLSLVMAGCGASVSGSEEITPENEEQVIEDDSGLTVTVKGSVITVMGPADETIGCAWTYLIRDEDLLTCTYNSLDDKSADRALQSYTFEALAPGRTAIELTYAQAWDGGAIETIRLLTCEINNALGVTASFS